LLKHRDPISKMYRHASCMEVRKKCGISMIGVDIRKEAFMTFRPAIESGLKMEGERTLRNCYVLRLEKFPSHYLATAFGYGDRRLRSINYREDISPQFFVSQSFYGRGVSGKGEQPERV
jgi:hypothetical protein